MERRDKKIIRYARANNQLLGIPTPRGGEKVVGRTVWKVLGCGGEEIQVHVKKRHFIPLTRKLVENVYNWKTEKEQYNCIIFSYLVQK